MDDAPLRSGELTIEPRPTSDGTLVLVWRGRSTDRQPARAIVPYVTLWLEKARHRGAPLCLEFGELEHMNSSTIATIVKIVQEAKARQTALTLSYDATKRWQKLGFEALRVIATADSHLTFIANDGS